MTRGRPGVRSGYDQRKPWLATRKSKPSLSISTTCGRARAKRRTSSASATGVEPPHADRLAVRGDDPAGYPGSGGEAELVQEVPDVTAQPAGDVRRRRRSQAAD